MNDVAVKGGAGQHIQALRENWRIIFAVRFLLTAPPPRLSHAVGSPATPVATV